MKTNKGLIRKRNKIWNKKNIILVFAIMLMLLLSGCSLAREDAGEEGQVNTDRLVGAFVT